jgi:hypothetical protein
MGKLNYDKLKTKPKENEDPYQKLNSNKKEFKKAFKNRRARQKYQEKLLKEKVMKTISETNGMTEIEKIKYILGKES